MKKLLALAIFPALLFSDIEFDRPNFHEFKDQQTLLLENIEHTMSDLRNEFAALAALLIETRRSNDYLDRLNSKIDSLLSTSTKTLFALETISWNQEHSLTSKKPSPRMDEMH